MLNVSAAWGEQNASGGPKPSVLADEWWAAKAFLDWSDPVDATDVYLAADLSPCGDDALAVGLGDVLGELGASNPQNVPLFPASWLATHSGPTRDAFEVIADYFEAVSTPNDCN